jgi:hypothetical protein
MKISQVESDILMTIASEENKKMMEESKVSNVPKVGRKMSDEL